MNNTNLTSEQDIQQWLINKTSEVTNLSSNEIDMDKEIMSYGLDSSSMMVILGELGEELNVELSIESLQDAYTINALSKNIYNKLGNS